MSVEISSSPLLLSNTISRIEHFNLQSVTNEGQEFYSVENIYPVRLTNAILQQCNFIFRDYIKFWQLITSGQPRTEMNIDLDYNIIDFMRRPVVKKLTSLHQLQNIYYMLHGKELDFDVDPVEVADISLSVAFAGN